MEKIILQKEQLKKAIFKLEESINMNSDEEIIRDGTIQRFEFTFELSWKTMKAVNNYQGLISNSPREAIKEAYATKLISNNIQWLTALKYRNLISHTYNEEIAKKIHAHIPSFIPLFIELLKNFNKIIT